MLATPGADIVAVAVAVAVVFVVIVVAGLAVIDNVAGVVDDVAVDSAVEMWEGRVALTSDISASPLPVGWLLLLPLLLPVLISRLLLLLLLSLLSLLILLLG